MIQSTKQAFDIIDSNITGIPYQAIDYLRSIDNSEEINQKLVYALKNAYNGSAYYSEKYRLMLPTPLWYLIVAEKHLSDQLFEPLLEMFTSEEDWDLMNEQAVYLVGLLAKKYPIEFLDKVLYFIEENIRKENKTPYIYSFEALYFANDSLFERIHTMLELENFYWIDHYIRILGDLKRNDTLIKFKELLPRFEGKHTAVELQYYIDVMEGRVADFVKGTAFSEMRDPEWKNHYKNIEHLFASVNSPVEQINKINRNDRCICGSGKKYKNCCLQNTN